jgi:hypothetical protein
MASYTAVPEGAGRPSCWERAEMKRAAAGWGMSPVMAVVSSASVTVMPRRSYSFSRSCSTRSSWITF